MEGEKPDKGGTKGPKSTQSGFLNTDAGEAQSFCGETISWYNYYLRKFNGVVILLVCYCVFSNSTAFFFKSSDLNVGLNDLTDVLYILLVFLRSRTGHLIDGVEERNLLKVRQRYQTSVWFVLDVITLVPYSYLRFIFPGDPLHYVVADKQKTYIRLHYVLYFIGIKEQEPGSSTTKYRVLLYLLVSCAMIHFFACGWYGLACSNMGYGDFNINLCTDESWMLKNLLGKIYELMYISNITIEGTYDEQIKFMASPYIMSLYWASSTSFSTGFGDIHAHTVTEKIYATLAMLGGVGFLYGMTVSGITSLLINNDARRAQFVHYYNAFKQELDNMHLKQQVKDICLKYFDFLWDQRKGTELVDMNIIPILPDYLQSLFAEHTYQPLLEKAVVFSSADEAFMSSLARCAKHEVYLAGQYVQRSGEIPAAYCYVKHGVVEILGSNETEVLGVMKEGAVFGQAHITCGLPRLNTLRCQINTELFVLQRHDFARLLMDYPEVSHQITQSIERQCMERKWPLQVNTMYTQELLDRRRLSRKTSISVESPRRHSTRRQSLRRMSTNVDEIQPQIESKSTGFDLVPMEKSEVVRRDAVATITLDGVELSRAVISSHTSRYDDSMVEAKPLKNADVEKAATSDEKQSFWKWLEAATIIEPNGKFRKAWELYILVLSLINYNITVFIFASMASLGREKLYTGDEVLSLPLLEMAGDGLYSFEAPVAEKLAKCDGLTELHDIVQCIHESGSYMSQHITGNITTGYTVLAPSTWDLSYFALSMESPHGIYYAIILYGILDLSFYINILVNLRTKVPTSSGTLITLKDIAKHYMAWNRFGLDFAIIIPIELLSPIFSKLVWHGRLGRLMWWQTLRGNRILCLLLIPMLFNKLEKSLDVNIVRLKLTQVIMYILSITNTLSSLSYGYSCSAITKTAYDFVENRIYKEMCFRGSQGWKDGITWERGRFSDYSLCFYYISTITTSTGYGDLPCTTKTKMVYAMVNMAIGTTLFGWLIAVIASGLSSDASATSSFMNSVLNTANYLKVHSVPSALVNRVLNCRYIQWVRYGGTCTPGVDTIGSKLSDNINELFMYEGTGQYVKRVPLFHELSPALISLLCNRIETHHYSAGDIVIYEGDLSSAIHMIRQGHCITVSADLERKIGVLHPGDYFCEMEVLHGLSSSRTVVADTTCEILLLYDEDIFEILDSYAAANFPLHKIIHDHSYEIDLVANLHKEKGKFEDELKMQERYAIQQVASGVRCYGDSLIDHPSVRYREDPVGSPLEYLLLPLTFDPNTKQYIIYETVRMILACATLIVMPLQIAFLPQEPALMVVQYLLDGFCLVDQYIKLHTMYYNDRQILVYHPISTAVHYLKTGFFGDLLCWFPFELLALAMPGPWTQHQWKFFALLRIPRFLQAIKVSRYLTFWTSDVRLKRRYVTHLSTVVFTILLHHWVSCLLFTFSCYPDTVPRNYTDGTYEWIALNGTGSPMYLAPDSWMGRVIKDNGLPALSIADSSPLQYLVTLYWATATLVCVGYGDVYPVTAPDRLVASFTMYLGLVYYSLVLGDIAANLQIDDTNRAKFIKRLADIKRFFKVHHVSSGIKNQVISFYCYLWERTRGVAPEDLLLGLSPSLKTSVCQNMYDEMLRESFGCSKAMESAVDKKDINGFFRILSTKIQPRFYLNGSVIFSRGNVGDEMYFVQRGNVALYEEDDQTISKVLGPGQFFGEIALFADVTRQRKVAALTNCDLSVLSKGDLDSILNAFPQFETIMKTIADERRVGGTRSASYMRPKSNADLTQNIVYDGDGNRADGQDKLFFSKVVDRNSCFATVWDNITVVLAWFSCCVAIYQAAYMNRNPWMDSLVFAMDIWFVMDMVVAFHTSYLDRFGNVVDTKEMIHAHYGNSKDKFLLDIIANVPIDLFGHAAGTLRGKFAVLSYLRLNRILRLRKFFENFNKWETDLHKDTLTVRMHKFVFGLFFVINFFGCGFYFVGCPGGYCDPRSWTTASLTDYKNKGILASDLVPWVDGCYWVVATITTTGYGDIRPETVQEIVYSCIVMVCGKLFIGYILSMLAATLANDDARRAYFQERVSAVKAYMQEMKFDNSVSEIVMRYYDYIWMKNQAVDVPNLFGDLCYSLKAEIFYEICGESFKTTELFTGCSKNFIQLLCTKVRPVAFMPGEYICVQGDVRSEMFIVYRGVVEVFETDDQHDIKPIRLILQGESYLCESVLKKTRLTCAIRSRTYVDAFFLQMEDLQDAIEHYKKDRDLLLENAYRIYGDLHLNEH